MWNKLSLHKWLYLDLLGVICTLYDKLNYEHILIGSYDLLEDRCIAGVIINSLLLFLRKKYTQQNQIDSMSVQ